MAFIFTCGTHTFQSLLAGYENITVQCQNCGNFSGKVTKRWEWFTFCFVPIIPFSLKPWHEVNCHICRFHQDIKHRPDVQQQMNSGAGAGGGQQIPLQNQSGQAPPQGWNSGNPYQQQSQPQYK
ncbi:hypothetical protein CLAFUW4_05128 [Fulvia fulva]|uniref:Uncharacterized protein n=1 Tax=Passalora fulva TaxID=5499 RepID=A0A9Q8PI45_PASFU|nr:uncharacterized protein CLAFUR5_11778 [Fulvia fulva]KAK4626968.1 hypothetical protein CLAFUR4_05114 [Fulvia fulva]KAK4627439.1 hypothetical protein CLAFUR0_05119 [Fulvia fulva]UJO22890.1 hypothetical protein CLAFUR5_11778 [Fulvia fulva]WPV14296.1 hypothetical protein CLAFUW4_05128 [Fulvia fulva]WPV28938.1 hypothetical protein CLAFUW7_05123 [Fulvia fulva]